MTSNINPALVLRLNRIDKVIHFIFNLSKCLETTPIYPISGSLFLFPFKSVLIHQDLYSPP